MGAMGAGVVASTLLGGCKALAINRQWTCSGKQNPLSSSDFVGIKFETLLPVCSFRCSVQNALMCFLQVSGNDRLHG